MSVGAIVMLYTFTLPANSAANAQADRSAALPGDAESGTKISSASRRDTDIAAIQGQLRIGP